MMGDKVWDNSGVHVLSIVQAAERLNISQSAVRKRLQRGLLNGEKDDAGKWWIRLGEVDNSQDKSGKMSTLSTPLSTQYIDSLKDQIVFLQQELARKDSIIMNLTSRIPLLPGERRRGWWIFGRNKGRG